MQQRAAIVNKAQRARQRKATATAFEPKLKSHGGQDGQKWL